MFLDLRGRPVLVLGGGPVAQRKAAFLERFGAVPRLRPRFGPADLAGCALAVGADAPEADLEALSLACRAAGIPVNVVDRPALCSALSPAVVDRGALVVAISSGGAAPVLARQVRAAIETLLPPRIGLVAELLDALKPALRGRHPDPAARRRAIARILSGPAVPLALENQAAAARDAAMRSLEEDAAPSGTVHLVAAGPGEADLLTLRAQRLMGAADVLVFGTDLPAAVLDLARRDAERICDDAPLAALVAQARQGRYVVRLAPGAMPEAFAAEQDGLRAAGVAVFVVPGAVAGLLGGPAAVDRQ